MQKFIEDFALACKLATNTNSNRIKHFEKSLKNYLNEVRFEPKVKKFIKLSIQYYAKSEVKKLRSK